MKIHKLECFDGAVDLLLLRILLLPVFDLLLECAFLVVGGLLFVYDLPGLADCSRLMILI